MPATSVTLEAHARWLRIVCIDYGRCSYVIICAGDNSSLWGVFFKGARRQLHEEQNPMLATRKLFCRGKLFRRLENPF
jgi:hypothetical protein